VALLWLPTPATVVLQFGRIQRGNRVGVDSERQVSKCAPNIGEAQPVAGELLFRHDSSGFLFPATILRWAICSFRSQSSACHCTRRSSALSRVAGCQFQKSWSGRVDLNHRPPGAELCISIP